jgi:hypothetical protein
MSIHRSRPRVLVLGVLLALIALVLAAPAAAHIVQIGPNLKNSTVDNFDECQGGCLFAQDSPSYVSPVDGKIVEWQVKGTSGSAYLETLAGNRATGGTGAVEAKGGDKETFSTNTPIKAGERFGITVLDKKGKVGEAKPGASATVSAWAPPLAVGDSRAPDKTGTNNEILVNVRIRPEPTVASISPASGPVQETNTMTVKGEDLVGVTGVQVGALFADFEEVSETELIVHPFGFTVGPAAMTIDAQGGSVTVPAAYTFEPAAVGGGGGSGANPPDIPDIPPIDPVKVDPISFPPEKPECRVPKLKGKTLKQARPLLAAAHCKLGKVTKRKGAKAATGKVKSAIPPAGAHAPADHKVAVTIG